MTIDEFFVIVPKSGWFITDNGAIRHQCKSLDMKDAYVYSCPITSVHGKSSLSWLSEAQILGLSWNDVELILDAADGPSSDASTRLRQWMLAEFTFDGDSL